MASTVGRIALGVVGALILAPVGLSAIGFSLGSAIGGMLFAPDGPQTEGPRIGDTSVTSSILGKTIPYHYAVTRTAGNVIWSGGIKESKEVETAGKGGAPATNTTYTYSSSFAISLGVAPAQKILRIWADGKPIYDITGASDVVNDKYKIRFHLDGSDGPDSLIQESINRRLAGLPDVNEGSGEQASYRTIDSMIADYSAAVDSRSSLYAAYLTTVKAAAEAGSPAIPDYGFAPSYSTLAYIVFDDAPLIDFGNRIPNITVEAAWGEQSITTSSSDSISVEDVPEISTSPVEPVAMMGVCTTSGRLVTLSGGEFRKFSLSSKTETLVKTATLGLYTATEILCKTGDGNLLVKGTLLGVEYYKKLNIDTLTYTDSGLPNAQSTVLNNEEYGSLCLTGQDPTVVTVGIGGEIYIISTENSTIFPSLGTTATATYTTNGYGPICSGGDNTVYMLAQDGVDWNLYMIRVEDNYTSVNAVTIKLIDSGLTQTVATLFYDDNSQSLYCMWDTGAGGILKKYDVSDPTISAYNNSTNIIVQTVSPDYTALLPLVPPTPKSGLQRSYITDGRIMYGSGNDVLSIDLSDGSSVVSSGVLAGVGVSAPATTCVYVSTKSGFFGWVDAIPRIVSDGSSQAGDFTTEVSAVIDDICEKAGLAPYEYDTSSIPSSYQVRGYTIGSPSNGRAAVNILVNSKFLDAVESDFRVKFSPQHTNPVLSINEEWLGSVGKKDSKTNWVETRLPDHQIPAKINLSYIDVDRNYQEGLTSKQRSVYPVDTMQSDKKTTIKLPLVLTEGEALDITERLLYQGWSTRVSSKTIIPWTYIALDATDIFDVTFNSGRTITEKVAKNVIGANFNVEIQSSRVTDGVFTAVDFSSVNSSNVPSIQITTVYYSKLLVLNLPLLYDYHSSNRAYSRYYVTTLSDTTSWSGSALYKSSDNIAFGYLDASAVDPTWGAVTSVLLAPRSIGTTDRVNTIEVVLAVDNGDVTAITYDDIINSDKNRAAIVNELTGEAEIIQFRDVTINVDGSLTLYNLSRGLNGTDYYSHKHTSGELFVLLPDNAILPEVSSLAEVGTTQYFKAASSGQSVGSPQSVANTMVANDLKPFAPTGVSRENSGLDLVVSWRRRTRFGGKWNMDGSGVEELPLNEDSEGYEMYLLDSTSTAFDAFDPLDAATYNKLYTSTVQSITIPDADLVTYSLSKDDTINVALYQTSGQVGRGFKRECPLVP